VRVCWGFQGTEPLTPQNPRAFQHSAGIPAKSIPEPDRTGAIDSGVIAMPSQRRETVVWKSEARAFPAASAVLVETGSRREERAAVADYGAPAIQDLLFSGIIG